MKDKNLLPDNIDSTLEELTDQANQIIESLENEKDLNNSVESYQALPPTPRLTPTLTPIQS